MERPSPHRWWRSALGLAGLAAVGCSARGLEVPYDAARPLESATPVVTLVDYLEGGRRSFDAFLAGRPGAERAAFSAAVERASRACARLEIVAARSGFSRHEVSGSGVLVATDGGAPAIVTTGHSFDDVDDVEATVTLRDGRRLAATAVATSYEMFGSSADDWAVLAFDEPPSGVAPLPTRDVEAGELVFTLGYPNRMGVDGRGRVVYGVPFRDDPLAPLLGAATVSATDPLVLRPVAGALPLGGASGGAIVDTRGNLVGLLTGATWTPDADGATYWIDGVPAASFADRVAAVGAED